MGSVRGMGIDFFPMDVGFYSDRKVKLLKSHFGAEGIIAFFYFLSEIYKKDGYFLEIDEEFLELAAVELSLKNQTIHQILQYLLQKDFFHTPLYQTYHILTSSGIQQRYQKAVEARGRKNPVIVQQSYWLLEKNQTKSYIKLSGNTETFPGKTPAISLEFSTKERKEKKKESKEKEKGKDFNFSPPLHNAIEKWSSYKKENKAALSDSSYQAFINVISEKLERFDALKITELIMYSIASGWKSIPWQRLEKEEKPDTISVKNQTAHKNRFINYEQRTWDFEQLERLEREQLYKDYQAYKNDPSIKRYWEGTK